MKTWRDKFKDASPAVKASMALLLANIIQKGISLISGPVFTRIMPAEQYGIVATFTSWQSILAVIVTLNLSSGVFNNGMLDYKDDRDSFQFSLLIISTCSTLLWLCVFLFLKKAIIEFMGLPELSIYFMFLNFLFVPAYSFWSARQRYEFKYKALCFVSVLNAVLSMSLGIAAVLMVSDSNSAITRIIVIEAVSIVIGCVFYIRICNRAKFKLNLEYCRYAIKFNIPLVPHYLSIYVLSSSDRVMITKMIGARDTAIYSVAYTVASVISIVWQSVEASLSPWIYERIAGGEKASIKPLITKVIAMFGVMSLSCTLLAPEIMMILAPEDYSSGVYVIPPIAAGVFFTAVYSIYMRIELYFKQTGFATIATTIAAGLNIILNFVFIQLFGAVAAGYTTMTCYAVLALLHFINVKKKGYADCFDNRAILLTSASVIVCAVLISLLYPYTIVRFVLIAAISAFAIIKRGTIIELVRKRK